jgi:hypothetical protein
MIRGTRGGRSGPRRQSVHGHRMSHPPAQNAAVVVGASYEPSVSGEHASVMVTLTVYGRVMPGDQKRAASRFGGPGGEA